MLKEMDVLQTYCNRMQSNGLVDIKFTLARSCVVPTVEQVAREVNLMLEAVDQGEAKPFFFHDSRSS